MTIKKVYIGITPSDSDDNFTCKVGTTSVHPVDADRGKPMKLIADSTYGFCADGDEIEAILMSVQNYTADQVTIGTCRSGDIAEAITTTTYNVGDFVVAAAQAANGTANGTFPYAKVKVPGTAPTKFLWRIVSVLSGTGGAIGDVVTIQNIHS